VLGGFHALDPRLEIEGARQQRFKHVFDPKCGVFLTRDSDFCRELSKNNKGTADDEAELEASSLLFALDAAHKEQQASLGGGTRGQHVRAASDSEDGFSDSTSSPGRKMMGTPGGGSRGAFNAENALPTTFEEEIGTPRSGGTARPMTPGDNKLMGDEPPMTPGGGLGRVSRPMTPGDGMDGSLNMSLNMSLCSALEKKGVWDC
jgi:hypothetical protein